MIGHSNKGRNKQLMDIVFLKGILYCLSDDIYHSIISGPGINEREWQCHIE